ncbi:MAG: UDP-3-O-acyl-N-acetylglucosamine deacetylase, partial [Fimbriimonadales bacterium]|nr:UDP-3-O-acyl-N-acetylglucosamine deacetylase [Fimbriimonadales bacterium]
MEPAKTLRETLRFEGVGLHSGELCRIALHPLDEPNPQDLPRQGRPCRILIRKGNTVFPARWDYVVDTARATTLSAEGVTVRTVEHLMAALWMTGITHCVIELLQGNEIPILDGSALPFVEALRGTDCQSVQCLDTTAQATCGTDCQSVPRWDTTAQATRCVHLCQVREADRYLALALEGSLLVGYIQFPAPLGVQAGAFRLQDAIAQIAPARTFGFLREVEALRQQGLARGGALDNALLIEETGYHNPARF